MDGQCDGDAACAEHAGHTDVETLQTYCDDHWSSHLGATVERYFPNAEGKVGSATHTAAILYGDLNAACEPCGEATRGTKDAGGYMTQERENPGRGNEGTPGEQRGAQENAPGQQEDPGRGNAGTPGEQRGNSQNAPGQQGEDGEGGAEGAESEGQTEGQQPANA